MVERLKRGDKKKRNKRKTKNPATVGL